MGGLGDVRLIASNYVAVHNARLRGSAMAAAALAE
jgi:hypothetical protein